MRRIPDADDTLVAKMQCPLVGIAQTDVNGSIRHRIEASGVGDLREPETFNSKAACGVRCALLLAPGSPEDFDHCYGIKWDPDDRRDWGPDTIGRLPCPACRLRRHRLPPTDFVIDSDGTIHNVSNRFTLPNSQETA